jgi:hypothetical protein
MSTYSKRISERIEVTKSGNDKVVVQISQKIPRWQESLLLTWLLAWTYCGGVFIYYAIVAQAFSDRIFFIICSSLFLFFFIRILKVFFWRIMGVEKVH